MRCIHIVSQSSIANYAGPNESIGGKALRVVSMATATNWSNYNAGRSVHGGRGREKAPALGTPAIRPQHTYIELLCT